MTRFQCVQWICIRNGHNTRFKVFVLHRTSPLGQLDPKQLQLSPVQVLGSVAQMMLLPTTYNGLKDPYFH